MMRAPKLREYQTAVLRDVDLQVAAGRRSILLVAPTGSGKTVMTAHYILASLARGMRVLFLAHRRELIIQVSNKLYELGIDHGILLPEFPVRLHRSVQIASIATLHARAIRTATIDLPRIDLVVIDEAHHARARTYQKLLAAYPNAIVLGLTATPCRADGRGLGNIFEVIVECPQVDALIAAGYLVPTTVYAPSQQPDLKGVRTERGDYAEGQLAERMDVPRLIGDIVMHWLRLAQNRRTVVFATGVQHSMHIRDEFCRAGVMAEHIDGNTPTEERDAILKRLASGEIDIVTNAQVLTEGWDCPGVACLVMARPTKSFGLYRQMIGRVMRPAAGKSHALVLDHAGATFRHGFAEDPIIWTLDVDRKAENAVHAARGGTPERPGLTSCPECSAIRMEGRPCPACGWRSQERPKSVAVADGELARVRRDRTVSANTYTAVEREQFHAQLVWIGRERNYKAGWAARKYLEKFNVWPRYGVVPQPAEPSASVRAWVRSRDIAWARSQARQ
jgi:DNA repair protein RadD